MRIDALVTNPGKGRRSPAVRFRVAKLRRLLRSTRALVELDETLGGDPASRILGSSIGDDHLVALPEPFLGLAKTPGLGHTRADQAAQFALAPVPLR
jgi:hypothetical protein